ncbi:MAG: DNA (cytosine-5-)-methyltransferase, partial [Bacteroidota bacterium]
GFDLAAEWMGWENVFHCEWNEFGQKILKHYWPKAQSYGDITKTDFNIHRGRIDILTGGFPCQPYSQAGKRLGKEDDRHLWPEMLRAIREIRPEWIVGENVLGIVNWNGGLVFDEVQADLEAEGYEVQPYVLPVVSVNAPHRRDRVWFVAYSNGAIKKHRQRENLKKKGKIRRDEKGNVLGKLPSLGYAAYTNLEGLQRSGNKGVDHKKRKESKYKQPLRQIQPDWKEFPTQPPVCTGNDGLSIRLDRITFPKWRNESIKGAGNAIVPQVAYQIFKVIEKMEQL